MSIANLPRVLIVDDEPDACTGLRRILRLDGFEADIAHSIAETLRPRPWSDYFAIILDRKLPDGTAEELVPQLKRLAPAAAIIIVTGYADLESSIQAIRDGVDDYLIKPINPELLRGTIARVLKLRKAEQRAEHAERLAAIGEFVTMMAHESRNYLQRIRSAADLLGLISRDDPEALAEIARISTAEKGLEHLLEDLRQFAAPMNLDKEICSLKDVWRQAWSLVSSTHHNATDATIDDANDEHGLRCEIDSFRFGQVFRNLFENSLSACVENPRVEIRCRREDRRLIIAICDNGPGLSAEAQQKIFEPFYSTKSNGTGLGMAITKRIVEAHGGENGFVTRSSNGAEFHIHLPIAATAEIADH